MARGKSTIVKPQKPLFRFTSKVTGKQYKAYTKTHAEYLKNVKRLETAFTRKRAGGSYEDRGYVADIDYDYIPKRKSEKQYKKSELKPKQYIEKYGQHIDYETGELTDPTEAFKQERKRRREGKPTPAQPEREPFVPKTPYDKTPHEAEPSYADDFYNWSSRVATWDYKVQYYVNQKIHELITAKGSMEKAIQEIGKAVHDGQLGDLDYLKEYPSDVVDREVSDKFYGLFDYFGFDNNQREDMMNSMDNDENYNGWKTVTEEETPF